MPQTKKQLPLSHLLLQQAVSEQQSGGAVTLLLSSGDKVSLYCIGKRICQVEWAHEFQVNLCRMRGVRKHHA